MDGRAVIRGAQGRVYRDPGEGRRQGGEAQKQRWLRAADDAMGGARFVGKVFKWMDEMMGWACWR